MQDGIVSTEWLASNLVAPDLRIVDASWHLPTAGRNARAEYEKCHIPDAVFFDLEEISDPGTDLPHMLPPAERFISRVRRLGLGDGNRIVVYDTVDIYSAARVWWMFRFFGHEDVAVLDGGLRKWLAEGHPTDDMLPMPRERHFTARRNWLLVRDASQVAHAIDDGGEQIVDARTAERFAGTVEEPRAELRRGHMPGARNLPFTEVLHDDGSMRSTEELKQLFAAAGVDLSQPVITTCGSGVTAAVLNLALFRIGHAHHALYDGSWAEWGLPSDRPVEAS